MTLTAKKIILSHTFCLVQLSKRHLRDGGHFPGGVKFNHTVCLHTRKTTKEQDFSCCMSRWRTVSGIFSILTLKYSHIHTHRQTHKYIGMSVCIHRCVFACTNTICLILYVQDFSHFRVLILLWTLFISWAIEFDPYCSGKDTHIHWIFSKFLPSVLDVLPSHLHCAVGSKLVDTFKVPSGIASLWPFITAKMSCNMLFNACDSLCVQMRSLWMVNN